MIYAICALSVCVILLLVLLLMPSREAPLRFDDMAALCDRIAHVRRSWRRPRMADTAIFGRCVRMLNGKKRRKEALFSFEKWLRDNDYTVQRAVLLARNTRWRTLPNVDGQARVVHVARYLVRHGQAADREQMANALATIQQSVPLYWPELVALPAAICAACCEQLYHIAHHSLAYHAAAKAAKRRRRATGVDHDAYLYYKYAEGYPHRYADQVLAARQRFYNVLLDSESKVKQYMSIINMALRLSPRTIMPLSTVTDHIQCHDRANLSCDTLLQYLGRIAYWGDRLNVTEMAVVHATNALARQLQCDFATVLFDPVGVAQYVRHAKAALHGDTKPKQRAYIACVVLFSLGISIVPTVLLRNIVAYVAAPLVCLLASFALQSLLQKVMPRREVVDLAMGYRTVPETAKTIVVVARYIDSVDTLQCAVQHLRQLACNVRDDNVTYCMLADLPAAAEAWSDQDEEIVQAMREAAKQDGLLYAVRNRVKEDRYVAWERKRGAILDLFGMLQTGDCSKFRYLSFVPQGCRFAVLLDDDSRLMPNGVLDAVNCMLHPANEKYDILTFEAATNPYSVGTVYALRYLDGVTGGYPIAQDFYERQFGTALYCGKAIVRVERFWRAMQDRLPDDRILSHDLLEGALLCTGSTHRTVYEDAPQTLAAHCLRQHRWQRGDVLLLPYVARLGRDRRGRMVANAMQPIYRFLLLNNALATLYDAVLVLCAFLGVLTRELWLLWAAVGALAFPFVLDLWGILRGAVHRRVRYTWLAFARLAWRAVERVLFLPLFAWRGAAVFFGTTFRSLFSRKSLLVWNPFFRVRNSANVVRYIALFTPAKIALAALGVLSNNPWFLLYAGAVWLTTIAWYFRIDLRDKKVSAAYTAPLRALAEDTYRYFCTFVRGGIVADTVQIAPPNTAGDMSSPTDMGFCVLSHACALLLGAPQEGCFAQLQACLSGIEKCKKWHGHLYNWYSCEGEVLGDVVSSVDSANFVACLLTTKQVCLAMGRDDLAARCAALARADFGALYDADRNMLVIAYHPKEKRAEGYYDTLASEARLAYLLATADGVPISAYYGLARDLTAYRGNTILSWGGTAFEYLLPRLFVCAPAGSLLRHSEYNAARMQVACGQDGMMGVSESCCLGFNDQMRYRYQANGLERLALHPDCGERVYTPYAAALVAQYLPDKGAVALMRMQQAGLMGEYGLYEAIQDGKVLQTYMAHHQGMLLAAITNILTENALCAHFMREERVASALLLVGEGQIQKAVSFRSVKRIADAGYSAKHYVYPTDQRAAHILVCGDTHGVFLSDGRHEVAVHGNLLGAPAVGRGYVADRLVGVRRVGETAVHNLYDTAHDAKGTFAVSGGSVVYGDATGKMREEIRLLPDGSGVVYDLCIDNDSEEDIAYEVSMVQSIALCDRGAYLSHRAYCDLFVVTAIDNAIVAYRRTQDGKATNRTVFGVEGLGDVHYTTNRRKALMRNSDAVRFDYGTEGADDGEVLYPCAAAHGTCLVPKHGQHHIYCLCRMTASPVADVLARNRQLYDSHIMPYYGMAECLSESAKLYDKYASERVAPMLASCLLDSYDTASCEQITGEQPLVLPYIDSVRQDLDAALTVRLLSAHTDARLAAPLQRDSNAALCARIAGNVCEGYVPFAVREVAYDSLAPVHGALPSMPPCMLESGEGYFCTPQVYVVRPYGHGTAMPYSNVVGDGKAGFVLTENGGGYLFGANSRQNKWTMWRNDVVRDTPTHWLMAAVGGRMCRLNDASHSVCEHGGDYTAFTTRIGALSVRAEYRVAGGCVRIGVEQKGGNPLPIVLALYPLLDWRDNPYCHVKKSSGKCMVLQNAVTKQRLQIVAEHATFFADSKGMAVALNGTKPAAERVGLAGCVARGAQCAIWLGENVDRTAPYYRLNAPVMVGGNTTLNLLMQGMWRQTVNSRLLARTGFYQCGGAYGFRDQLQDAMAYLYADSGKVRAMIVEFARHQYAQGDVMHWWHPPRTGVRTQVTDDRLFLCYAVARYVQMTGDDALLEEKLPFMVSDPLAAGQESRYETPAESRQTYAMAEHLKRALASVLRYGEHDLLLVGGGDWNDGINRIGLDGKGESVWLSMFAYLVMQQVCRVLPDWQDWLGVAMRRLKKGIGGAFVRDRFVAYYTDDGRVLGNGIGHCALYLMPQAFAAFCGAVDKRVASVALNTAKQLVDYDRGTVALFDPPFDAEDHVGYIAAYPKGVRENGGQYTHAVAWYIKGLLAVGETEYAYELLQLINPIVRCSTRKDSQEYAAEPYVLAADVYRHDTLQGKAGWTWYTGSAAWLWRVVVEDMYGVRIVAGKLYLQPNLPKALVHSTLYLDWQGTRYCIRYRVGDSQKLTVGEDQRALEYIDLARHDSKVEVYCHCKR